MSKVVIVTGGSQGIGAATSKLLANHGYQVCVNYCRSRVEAESVVSEISAAGGQALAVQADISEPEAVKKLFDTTEEKYGTITHLVNNAGILFTQSSLIDIDINRFEQVLRTNLLGSFLCCREAIPRMPSGSAIVNVSSIAARTGSPNEYIDYAASKGALDTLTKGLSLEVAKKGIRVNSVRPGFIETTMHADGGEPERIKRLSQQIPLQRGGQVEEAAQAIYWLLSDKSSYVTGTFIDVTGGK